MNLSGLKSVFLRSSPLTRAAVRLMAGPGPITMLLLVRDESDIIAENIQFHLGRGIQTFVVTDNGSTDGTRDILRDFEQSLGSSFLVLDDPELAHLQAQRVNRMIGLARERFHPRWILSADADEFWFPASGSYASEFDGRANILDCYWHNFLPRPNTAWQDFSDIGEMPGYHGRMKKTLCLARGLLGMYAGNHEARTIPHVEARSENIRVYHYPVRSYQQFERKVIHGHRATVRAAEHQNVAWHWREYYQAWQEGRLPEMYASLAANNRVAEDSTMAELFGKLKPGGHPKA
ncbi:glycosyltransferase family 2 protein [Terriglobus aquaticus]|uniref:Glycosyltransferase family 2 protein n=1 Tax=Terriglobus aquaticus TaxID=940139 RepID=A0ABW9KI78_9BACT|nr:glycosyltransferase family 2 protein [Terriglobus aquaticus]